MGSGFRTFAASEVLTSSNVQNYLMTQSVMYFVSTTARDIAITSPVAGMVAFIDSNDANEGLYVYHGATGGWRKGPGWNAPWGVVASAKITTSTAAVGATLVTGSNLNFSVIQNRRYKYTVFGHQFFASVNDTMKVAITNGTGTEFAQTNLLVVGTPNVSFAHGFGFTWYEDAASSAAITRQLRVSRLTGTSGNVTFFADATRIGSFIIEDIGPSGAPA
jgi:hypothetical protein